jgi:hypothetical protein
MLDWNPASKEHSLKDPRAPCHPLLLFHCDIDELTIKGQKGGEKVKRVKKAVPGLSFMEKEQEKIALQPNIYRKENKQHQIENQSHRLRRHAHAASALHNQLLCSASKEEFNIFYFG